MKRRIGAVCGAVIILVLVIVLLMREQTATTSSSSDSCERDVMAMDTYMTVTVYGEEAEEAADAAIDEINRLDTLLSTGNEESNISQINTNGGGTLCEDAKEMVSTAISMYHSTDKAFDIAIYPIMEAWGFTGEHNYRVPEESEIQELLPLTNLDMMEFDETTGQVTFDLEGMKIDLGGIAKGYTSQRLMDIFEEYKVTSAVVSLGGNVETYGAKPDGSLWNVGIRDPEDTDEVMASIKVKDCAVISSGGYERYFEQDGITYHHIIDPKTGYPADSGLTSVTIVCPDGTMADALSTAVFVMGKDKAVEYWQAHSDEFDMILCDEEGILWVTEGIADSFTSEGRSVENVYKI